MKDKINWFGEKAGSSTKQIIDLTGKAILGVTAVVVLGSLLNSVGKSLK